MNLRHLRAFVTVADAGSLANAAMRLHLSQPALSRQIDSLERELGVAVFERVGRRSRVTAEGEYLLRQCRRVLADVNTIAESAGSIAKGDTGVLRVGASPQFIEFVLSAFIARFVRRHPRVEFRVLEAGGVQLRRMLEHGDISIAILPDHDPRLGFQALYPICSIAVLPPGHALGKNKTLEVARLDGEPVLLLNQDFILRDRLDAACRIANVRPNVRFESASPHAIAAMAANGHGIGIIPSLTQMARPGARLLPVTLGGAAIGMWLVAAWEPTRSLPSFARSFVGELADSLARQYPGRAVLRRLPALRRPSAMIGSDWADP